MSMRPNDKVMTAALTRNYEKTVQFWVGHRTAAVSTKQTSAAVADYSGKSIPDLFYNHMTESQPTTSQF